MLEKDKYSDWFDQFFETSPLKFKLSKIELTLLFLILHDAGKMKFNSDSELAKFLETFCTYNGNKIMRNVHPLISKLRSREHNEVLAREELIKIISQTEIRTTL